jgi:hypothetical protein
LPLWRACQLPEFLEGRDRNEAPKREIYAPDDGEKGTGGLDNGRVNNIYWEHLLEHELTILRDVFLKEIANIESR